MRETRQDPSRNRVPVPDTAIEALYRHEAGRLTRFFARRLHREAEAQDLTQDAFLKLARASISGDPLPYLLRIARNLLVTKTRSEARWRKVVTDVPVDEESHLATAPDQSLNIEAQDVKRQYQRVIDQLPEKTRRI